MKVRTFTIALLAATLAIPNVSAQLPKVVPADSWQVNIRTMNPEMREKITETMEQLDGSEEDRGLISEIGQAVGFGLVSSAVDIIVTETFNLAQMRKRQKQEWMKMIEKENNYTDSISSIKGLNDFYTSPSSRGALDPSDINFDGIEIRGIKDGQEVIYMSCSIDRSKLDNLFNHSKFNLVIDTLAFYPYQCHLPNVAANGIRLMSDLKKGKAQQEGALIVRPGEGGNGFSFKERKNLNVGIDFSITSSWINEAVQVHKDVELGNFHFNISIPDNKLVYTYSREDILRQAADIDNADERAKFLADNLIGVEGDSFVVPRSYMPLANGKRLWGTGEYNIKVKVRESCRFDNESDKAKHWREDYKRLRQMQNRSGEVREYFQTLWNQNGMNLIKQSYKTGLTTGLNHFGLTQQGAAAKAAAAKTQKAAAPAK